MLKAPKVFKKTMAVSQGAWCLLLISLLLFATQVASAQPRTSAPGPGPVRQATPAMPSPPAVVALMPFDGKDTPAPPKKPLQPMTTATAVADTLAARPQAKYYKVLGPDMWAGMARLKHHGRPSDIRPIARLVKASMIIGGFLEATPGPYAPKPYRLTVTVYDDQGQVLGQLGYDVDKSTISPQQFGGQATAFFQLLDQGLHLPGAAAGASPMMAQSPPSASPPVFTPPPATTPAAWQTATQKPQLVAHEGPVVQLEDKEQAPLGVVGPLIPHSREAREQLDRRPGWLPAFDVRVGYLYTTRSFSNQGSDLRLPRSGANGAVLHAELYPFSFMKRAGAALAGLGARFTAMLPVWSDIGQASTEGGPVSGYYAASEQRLEGAIRWQYNYWNEILRPVIELEGLYGDHKFSLTPKQNIDYLHLPPSEYKYLGGMIGARLFFTHQASMRLGFTFAKLLSLGDLSTPAVDAGGQSLVNQNGYKSYGPGDGVLWRVDLAAAYNVWKGITLGAAFFYEQNKLTFTGPGNILQTDQVTPVAAAQDESMGIMFTFGYAYRPFLN